MSTARLYCDFSVWNLLVPETHSKEHKYPYFVKALFVADLAGGTLYL